MFTDIPDYPAGYSPTYCTTDRDAAAAGCYWGLILAKRGSSFWVLTNIGVRYYGVPSEHQFLDESDPNYDAVHACWSAGIAYATFLQSHLPKSLRESV